MNIRNMIKFFRNPEVDHRLRGHAIWNEYIRIAHDLKAFDENGRVQVAKAQVHGSFMEFSVTPVIGWKVTRYCTDSGGTRDVAEAPTLVAAKLMANLCAKASHALQSDLDLKDPRHEEALARLVENDFVIPTESDLLK